MTYRTHAAASNTRRLNRRQCVACGYDGALLQNGAAARCARCGCDLRERPARSYAEMEGLTGDMGPGEVTTLPSRREERLVHKWLAFLFISLLFIVTLGYFAAAAFGI